MKKEQSLRILKDHFSEIQKYHVTSIAIFGSVARDENTETSDIDILVEFDSLAIVGLLMFIDLKDYLSEILGCAVDLATLRSLRKEMKPAILEEMICAS